MELWSPPLAKFAPPPLSSVLYTFGALSWFSQSNGKGFTGKIKSTDMFLTICLCVFQLESNQCVQKFICANGGEATDSDMEPERKELTAGETEDHENEKPPKALCRM